MNQHETLKFIGRVDNLFPSKLTKEMKGVWYKRLMCHTEFDVNSAIEDYISQPKRPGDGAQPSLNALLRILRNKNEMQDTTTQKKIKTLSRYQTWTSLITVVSLRMRMVLTSGTTLSTLQTR